MGGVHPDEEGFGGGMLAGDEILARSDRLVVDRLHPLLGQRTGILDPLLADPARSGLVGRVVGVGRPGVDDAARAESLAELWEVGRRWIVRRLGILFGVKVVEVTEEL